MSDAAKLLEGWFDGACEPTNPGGHAAWGAVLCADGAEVWKGSGHVGVGPAMSNNVAEYSGVIAVLEQVLLLPAAPVLIRGDSNLVIKQLGGYWCAKPGKLYTPYFERALDLLSQVEKHVGQLRVKFQWVPREQNGRCDGLSKQVLIDRGVRFRIQPEAKSAP